MLTDRLREPCRWCGQFYLGAWECVHRGREWGLWVISISHGGYFTLNLTYDRLISPRQPYNRSMLSSVRDLLSWKVQRLVGTRSCPKRNLCEKMSWEMRRKARKAKGTNQLEPSPIKALTNWGSVPNQNLLGCVGYLVCKHDIRRIM